MLVTLSTFTLARQTSLIQNTSNITSSSCINDHDIRTHTTSHINHVEVNTLTIDQSRIKERHTLQISSVAFVDVLSTGWYGIVSWHVTLLPSVISEESTGLNSMTIHQDVALQYLRCDWWRHVCVARVPAAPAIGAMPPCLRHLLSLRRVSFAVRCGRGGYLHAQHPTRDRCWGLVQRSWPAVVS